MMVINKCLTLFFLFLFSLNLLAKEYVYKDYAEAKSARSFILFEMESTKFGLLTTSFD